MHALTANVITVLADGQFHTGDALGAAFGVSKTSIWKAISALQDIGLDVHCVRGKGYRLSRPLTLLDETVIRRWLPDPANAAIRGLTVLPQTDSTNAWMLRLLHTNESAGGDGLQICLSEMQTAGRGRRGRAWVSPFGQNVYLSVLKRFDTGAASLSGLSLVVGLAVTRTLALWSIPGVGLKWPNDIYCHGRKLGGVLLEISGDLQSRCHVVIGLGLNVVAPIEAMGSVDQPWTDLSSQGFNPVNRNLLVARLLESLVDVLARFESQGFGAFAAEWQAVDLSRGCQLSLTGTGAPVEGTGLGVDDTGALLVDTASGVQRFHGGEVSLRLQ